METNPYPDKVPGSRAWDREHGEDPNHRHEGYYGGPAPCTVTIYGPSGGRGDGGRGPYPPDHRDEEFPPPASLPLTGSEQMVIKQYVAPWNRLRNVVVNVISFITSFFRTSYYWAGRNLTADTPSTALFVSPPYDMLYEFNYSVACRVADGGASTGTYTLTATTADGTSFATQTCNLASAGNGGSHKVNAMIPASTSVSFQFLGGGTYGGAQYTLIVSAIPMTSLLTTQAPNNVMY